MRSERPVLIEFVDRADIPILACGTRTYQGSSVLNFGKKGFRFFSGVGNILASFCQSQYDSVRSVRRPPWCSADRGCGILVTTVLFVHLFEGRKGIKCRVKTENKVGNLIFNLLKLLVVFDLDGGNSSFFFVAVDEDAYGFVRLPKSGGFFCTVLGTSIPDALLALSDPPNKVSSLRLLYQ